MSHEEGTDLRIRRTHKFLQEAMIELITEKGFEAITVGDITDRAMINRATFYRHYQDKYDLVAKIFEETTKSLVENMKPIRKAPGRMNTMNTMNTQNTPEIWIQIFEHVAEHARLYKAMLGKNGSSWFAARMREYTIKIMLEQERRWEHSIVSRRHLDQAMPQNLPVTQLSHVLIGTIVWWLESEKTYTPGQIATWFHSFAFYGYLAALGYESPILWKE